MNARPVLNVKDEAHRVIDSLPNDAEWEDVIHALYVRERVERGLAQAECEEVTEHDEVVRGLELDE